MALRADSLRCRISEAIGAKRTCRERRERVDLTKMTPTRTWSEGRADTVALATEQCAPVLMKGRRRLRRLIYDDVKLVRDTIQRLGAGTAPPGDTSAAARPTATRSWSGAC